MSLESAINARLDGYAGLTALVGERNYMVTMPQGTTMPATTTQIVSEIPLHAMSADAGYREARIMVNSFGSDFSMCRDVDEQVRLALSRYSGTSSGTVVQDILEEGTTDLHHGEVKGGIFQRARDFRVFYEV